MMTPSSMASGTIAYGPPTRSPACAPLSMTLPRSSLVQLAGQAPGSASGSTLGNHATPVNWAMLTLPSQVLLTPMTMLSSPMPVTIAGVSSMLVGT